MRSQPALTKILKRGSRANFPIALVFSDSLLRQGFLVRYYGRLQFVLSSFLRFRGQPEKRLGIAVSPIQPLLGNVIEERKEPVKIALRNWIVFVIVASRTTPPIDRL